MSDFFYRAFEEKYRGSRELIKSRLQVYLPFIQLLHSAYPAGKALDVGCGRGEWLELMVEQGFDAVGVDLDDGMLDACRERGLNVQTVDALVYLKSLPESSLCVVSGFHLAEHLPFDVLQELVQETKRVLLPGGLMILETPNPENIVVGTSNFYCDPTHLRPLPPRLLGFLPEYYGYQRVKVLRLQESQSIHSQENPKLMSVLGGVSPDFAVVAQKQGDPLLVEAFNPLFQQSFGITLDQLAARFQNSLERRLDQAETQAQQAQDQAMKAEAKAQQAQEQAMQAEAKAKQAQEQAMQAESKAQQAQEQAMQAEAKALVALDRQHTNMMIRWLVNQWSLLRKHGVNSRAKALGKKLLRNLADFVKARPILKAWAKRMAYSLGMAEQIKRVVLTTRHQHLPTSGQHKSSIPTELAQLSPRAREIYADLIAAKHQQHKGGS